MLAIGHLLWMGAGALGTVILKSIWDFLAKCFGFKAGIIESMEKGRRLTPEEKAEFKERLKAELVEKLKHEQTSDSI